MKTIKSVLFSVFLFTILFSCALKPTEIEKEKKDYQGTIHNVENANYEFEERLNSFYESEHIANKDLDKLYKGEYPDGETEPTMLRIHWQKARELAIAELELQKAIQTNWQEAKISLRPVLALDRDGGDYYRYYEYRVLKDDNAELGAIRIPVYRRTENFTTSEVHVYSSDGKTYKMFPSMWGSHISANLVESKTADFYKSIEKQSTSIVTENYVYNALIFLYSDLELEQMVEDFQIQPVYDQLYAVYNKSRGSLKVSGKGSLSENDRDLIIDGVARKNTYEYRDAFTELKKILFKFESTAMLVEDSVIYFEDAVANFTSMNYFMALTTISLKMTDNKANTLITKTIKDIHWDYVEKESENTVKKFLLEQNLDIYKELEDRAIKPVMEHPNYANYPQKQKHDSYEYRFEEYRLLSGIEKHKELIASRSGFESDDGIVSSIFEPLSNEDFNELSELMPKAKNINASLFNRSISKQNNSLSMGNIGGDMVDLANLISTANGLYTTISPWIDLLNGLNAFEIFGGNDKWEQFKLGAKLLFTKGFQAWDAVVNIKKDVYKMSDEFDKVMGNMERTLGKQGMSDLADNIDSLSKCPFLSQLIDFTGLKTFTSLVKGYVKHGPGLIKDTFNIAFDSWTVWYVPILPFPTGWWTVDKDNKNRDFTPPNRYAIAMGLPTAWRFDLDNIVPPDKNPPVKGPSAPKTPANPELEFVDERLKPYGQEWLSVNRWLTDNKMYEVNDEGIPIRFPNINTNEIGELVISLMDSVYNLYSGASLVYIDKSKPYTEATNIITNIVTNKPPIRPNITNYITSIVYNVVDNPSKAEKDEQNKYNINKLKDIVNTNYNITLKAY